MVCRLDGAIKLGGRRLFDPERVMASIRARFGKSEGRHNGQHHE